MPIDKPTKKIEETKVVKIIKIIKIMRMDKKKESSKMTNNKKGAQIINKIINEMFWTLIILEEAYNKDSPGY